MKICLLAVRRGATEIYVGPGDRSLLGGIVGAIVLLGALVGLANGVFDRGTKEIERDSRKFEREQVMISARDGIGHARQVDVRPESEARGRQDVAERELTALRTREIEAEAALTAARVAALEAERARVEAAARERLHVVSSKARTHEPPASIGRRSASGSSRPSQDVVAVAPSAVTRRSVVEPAPPTADTMLLQRQVDQMQARIRSEEQSSVYSVQRDMDFLALAQKALANGVTGRQCKWLISHARVLRGSIGLDTAAGSYRLPDEYERIASRVAGTSMGVCDEP